MSARPVTRQFPGRRLVACGLHNAKLQNGHTLLPCLGVCQSVDNFQSKFFIHSIRYSIPHLLSLGIVLDQVRSRSCDVIPEDMLSTQSVNCGALFWHGHISPPVIQIISRSSENKDNWHDIVVFWFSWTAQNHLRPWRFLSITSYAQKRYSSVCGQCHVVFSSSRRINYHTL